jgi:Bacterial Ig-like domain (group 2)
MKARLGITIGALVVLTSCANDNPVAPTPTPSSLTVSCGVTGFTTIGQQGACVARLTLSDAATTDLAAGVQWSSSDPAKVTVSSSGVMTAVSPGSAEISAVYSGLSAKQRIDVTVACAFSVFPTTVSLTSQGGTQNVTLTATPAGCSPQTWTASSGAAALTVSPTAGSGSATITLAAGANTGTAAEARTATIAGQTVTAMIAAAPPPPPPAAHVLTVTLLQGEHLSGPYAGTVTGPNGFTCTLVDQSKSCPTAQFDDGQVITLNVTLTVGVPGDRPIQRAVGCDALTANTCTLTMTADRSVTISIGCAICAGLDQTPPFALSQNRVPVNPLVTRQTSVVSGFSRTERSRTVR